MELTECSSCAQSTHEWIEVDEQALCGQCAKDSLVPVECSLCGYELEVFVNLLPMDQPLAYCGNCLDILQKARRNEIDSKRIPRGGKGKFMSFSPKKIKTGK